MRTLRAWFVRVGDLLRRNRREREMAEEFESHLQLHIDDNVRAGMPSDEARRAALVTFGPVEAVKEDWRDRAGIPIVEILLQDLRYAQRRLAKQPAFAALVVLTIALGVGANAVMLRFVQALVFSTPAHVHEPERLVAVKNAASYPRVTSLSQRLQSVELAAYTYPRTQSLGSGGGARPLATQCVTGSYFETLRVPALAGRIFTTADERAGSGRPLVIAHRYWIREMSGDLSVVGRDVMLSGLPFTIIGVAPRGFAGVGAVPADAWTPVALSAALCSGSPSAAILKSEASGWLTTIGRLAQDADLAQAAAELATIEADRKPFVAHDGEVIDTRATVGLLYPSRRPALTRDGRLASWLAGGAALLLLLACANVAGLLSMRAVDRRREVAIRLQLGAGRARVAGQLIVEHLLMAVIGGLAAVVVVLWLGGTLQSHFARAVDTDLLDLRMLAFLMVLALFTGVASGTLPAIYATRSTALSHLRTGKMVVAGRSRGRSALLTLQVALALMLIVGAGLFTRSVQRFRGDFAYDLDRVIVASIDTGHYAAAASHRAGSVLRRLQQVVDGLSVVESSALTSGSIGFGGSSSVTFMGASPENLEPHERLEVSPGYFATLGLDLTSGRAFTDDDAVGTRKPVVINQLLAREVFGAANPLGRCLYIFRDCHTVLGVAEPFRSGIGDASLVSPQVFAMLDPGGGPEHGPEALLIRTRGNAADDLTTVAAALQGASPDVPFVDVRPLTALVDLQASSWRLGAAVFSMFGVLALALAAIGLYGALAFVVRQRTPEIGVRIALGAERSDVVKLVVVQAGTVVVAGCLAGGLAALGAGKFVQSLLFNTPSWDGTTFMAAAAVIVVAAAIGASVPAVRAVRVDPVVALRSE